MIPATGGAAAIAVGSKVLSRSTCRDFTPQLRFLWLAAKNGAQTNLLGANMCLASPAANTANTATRLHGYGL